MTSIPEWDLPRLLSSDASLRRAMQVIDRSALNVALVVDSQDRLLGIVTDGDVRRALLGGADLNGSVISHMSKNVITARAGESRAAVLDLMMSRVISHVPVVDEDRRLLGLHTLRNVLGRASRRNAVLILAGGRGTRLGRVTKSIPKPMIRVAGRPILERLINHCVGHGFTDITLAVSYLANEIESYFGNGSEYGCAITYMHDRDGGPRGTGGPFVDFIHSKPDSTEPVLVINGDLITDANLSALVDSHSETGAQMTVAVCDYFHEVPYGVVETDASGCISQIEEKPLLSATVSAGIYVLSREVVKGLPTSGLVPMTDVIRKLLLEEVGIRTFRIATDWVDVGSPSELRKARGSLDFN